MNSSMKSNKSTLLYNVSTYLSVGSINDFTKRRRLFST